MDKRKQEGTGEVKEGDTRWCFYGMELSCDNGERVKVEFALDCCDREIVSLLETTKGIVTGLVDDFILNAMEKRIGLNGQPSENFFTDD